MGNLVSIGLLAMRSKLFLAILGILLAGEYFFSGDFIHNEYA